jgi:hypothetical protein
MEAARLPLTRQRTFSQSQQQPAQGMHAYHDMIVSRPVRGHWRRQTATQPLLQSIAIIKPLRIYRTLLRYDYVGTLLCRIYLVDRF